MSEIPNFYNNQIDILDWNNQDSELEKLKLQKEILRLELELQNWVQSNNENLHQQIDFEIIWWYIEKKVKKIDVYKWKIRGLKNKIERYKIWYSPIIPLNDWKYNFDIKLNNTEIIHIKYKWNRTIHIFDNEWNYIETTEIKIKSKNPPIWFINIKTYNWKIVLFLDLSRKKLNHQNKKRRY
jgi:hypothetical protein